MATVHTTAFVAVMALTGVAAASPPDGDVADEDAVDPNPPQLQLDRQLQLGGQLQLGRQLQLGGQGFAPAPWEPAEPEDPHVQIRNDYYPDFRPLFTAAFIGFGSTFTVLGSPLVIAGSVWAHDQDGEGAVDWRPVTMTTVGAALVALGATSLTIGIVLATSNDDESIALHATPNGAQLVFAF
jgi:hypothetical protein